LQALARVDLRTSNVVELKFFGGLETDEILRFCRSRPHGAVGRKLATAWLRREMTAHAP
jgi:hypothetical protein